MNYLIWHGKYFGILLMILFFSACSKDGGRITERARGIISDFTTGKGIPNVSLELMKYDFPLIFDRSGGPMYFRADTTIAEGHFSSDANGHFDITYSFNPETSGGRSLNAIAKNYFNVYPSRLEDGDQNIIRLMPKAYLNLQFVTTSTTDTVIFHETITEYQVNSLIINRFIQTQSRNRK